MLPQESNPVHARYNKYKDWGMDKAEVILSYQQNNGGWEKNKTYGSKKSNGGSSKGTFDNGATTVEMTFMAHAFNQTGDEKYRASARKAVDYVLDAQYPSGGWHVKRWITC